MKTNSIKRAVTPAEAKKSLQALAILSGKAEPSDFKPPQKKEQREAKIQTELFKWAKSYEWEYPELRLMFHIANEGKRSAVSGYHLKQQGLKSGLPDICLPIARGGFHALYIELKAESGRLQDNQKQWLDDLTKQGYKAVTAFGLEKAKEVITDYLSCV